MRCPMCSGYNFHISFDGIRPVKACNDCDYTVYNDIPRKGGENYGKEGIDKGTEGKARKGQS